MTDSTSQGPQGSTLESLASGSSDAAACRLPQDIELLDTEEEQSVDDGLDCAICLQTCIHPVKLPCSHIFCYLCVKGVANHSKRCALCRSEIPPDFLVRPMLLDAEGVLKTQAFDGKYQWFYEGVRGWWQYDVRASTEIEDRYQKGERMFDMLIAGFLYVVDMENMVQYQRSAPSRRRRIKRDLVDIPDKKGVAGLSCRLRPPRRMVGDGGEREEATANSVQPPSQGSSSSAAVGINNNNNSSNSHHAAVVAPDEDNTQQRVHLVQRLIHDLCLSGPTTGGQNLRSSGDRQSEVSVESCRPAGVSGNHSNLLAVDNVVNRISQHLMDAVSGQDLNVTAASFSGNRGNAVGDVSVSRGGHQGSGNHNNDSRVGQHARSASDRKVNCRSVDTRSGQIDQHPPDDDVAVSRASGVGQLSGDTTVAHQRPISGEESRDTVDGSSDSE